MSREGDFKVVSIAAWCTVHDHSESRVIGEAIRDAVEASDSKVLLVASGSLSHKIWANQDYAANNGTFTISSEFNRQMDLRVLELWQKGDHATFLKMLGEYADFGCCEGSMHDTAMLYGALGWDSYTAPCEVITEYFPSFRHRPDQCDLPGSVKGDPECPSPPRTSIRLQHRAAVPCGIRSDRSCRFPRLLRGHAWAAGDA